MPASTSEDTLMLPPRTVPHSAALASSARTTRRTSLSHRPFSNRQYLSPSSAMEVNAAAAASASHGPWPTVTVSAAPAAPTSSRPLETDPSVARDMTARLAASAARRAGRAMMSAAAAPPRGLSPAEAAAAEALRLSRIEYERQQRIAEHEVQQRGRHEVYRRARAELQAATEQQQLQQQQQHQPRSRHETHNASPRSARPAAPQHRVYLLNCRGCGLLLSNRGMKAVLLLRPNITLYSTDALPANCRPVYQQQGLGLAQEPAVQRTCDCLTQSLGCNGCGSQIGYMILAPCDRCNNSVAKHQRSSNGHRTVLHCSEITVRERRYVPGEAGVHAIKPPTPVYGSFPYRAPSSAAPRLTTRAALRHSPHHVFLDGPSEFASEDDSDAELLADAPEYDSEGSDEMDIDAEKAEVALEHARAQADAMLADMSSFRHARPTPISLNPSRHAADPAAKGRVIRRGEVLLWSDLAHSGECAEPYDSDLALEMLLHGR